MTSRRAIDSSLRRRAAVAAMRSWRLVYRTAPAQGRRPVGDARPRRWYNVSAMRYFGAVIRPPSEASSLIVQVTYGCSNACCDFCGTYLDKPFGIRPLRRGRRRRRQSARAVKQRMRRVFLADGDALALSRAPPARGPRAAARRAAAPRARELLRQRPEPAEQERRRPAASYAKPG